MDEIRLAQKEYKHYYNDKKMRRQLMEAHRDELRMVPNMVSARAALAKIREEMNGVRNAKRMSDEERRMRLERLYEEQKRIMTKFEGRYYRSTGN